MTHAWRFSTHMAVCLSLSGTAVGGIITFDFLDPSGTGNTAGEAFELGNPFADMGVTISASVATTLGSGTGSYSANTSTAGIDSDGVTSGGGDAASELDAGETLTISFTFSGLDVSLQSVDFGGVGSDTSDMAIVALNGGAGIELYTGQPDFNGTTDLWTPSGFVLQSGDQMSFSTSDRAFLTAMTVSTAAVPEPSTFLMLLITLVGVAGVRRHYFADNS